MRQSACPPGIVRTPQPSWVRQWIDSAEEGRDEAEQGLRSGTVTGHMKWRIVATTSSPAPLILIDVGRLGWFQDKGKLTRLIVRSVRDVKLASQLLELVCVAYVSKCI